MGPQISVEMVDFKKKKKMQSMKEVRFQTKPKQENPTKGLVTELAPPYVQSAWGSKGEMIQVAGLAACCNYFSKKKKKREG